MSTIVFYEKPGCATNARQRRLLQAAGHQLQVRNLLTETWTAERLKTFFAERPITDWFNPAAPRIKSGAINPARLGHDEALALLVAEPLLIKRPLLEIDGKTIAGFDPQQLQTIIDLHTNGDAAHLQACTHQHSRQRCSP
ncbi:MAG: ArsC/Spx/MgsR family protein [Steroidobacteraceae bacterium]